MDWTAFFQAVLLLLGVLTSPPEEILITTDETAIVTKVIDGDTIEVRVNGERELVRYIGIDTPEAPRNNQDGECGHETATKQNALLVEGASVRLVADQEDRDRYDRLLRYVYVETETGEIFVNQVLLETGLAEPLTIPPNTYFANTFLEVSKEAERKNLGIFATCSGR